MVKVTETFAGVRLVGIPLSTVHGLRPSSLLTDLLFIIKYIPCCDVIATKFLVLCSHCLLTEKNSEIVSSVDFR